MTRYRWYEADWPMSVRTLAKQMKKRQFDESTPDGFVVDRVRDDYLEARFIEHLEFTETVIDPFGRERTVDRVAYSQSELRASTFMPGLELTNAPRSSHAMVSRLLEITNFSLAITALSVDVLQWARHFQESARYDAVVDSVQIGSLELGQGVRAKAVVMGDRDVRDAVKIISGGRRHVVERMQLRVRGEQAGTVLLSSNGMAKVNFRDSSGVVDFLRSSLASTMSRR